MSTDGLLVLFAEDWDLVALARHPRLQREHAIVREGFDLFRFPDNAGLLWFDARRFVDRMTRRYRGRVAAVISTNEQYGALIAATLARRLGLPGTDPLAVVRSQHKHWARRILADAVPEAVPRFDVIPYDIDAARRAALPYPLFVKPVKAAFSVLARRVDTPAELTAHLSFSPWERIVIRRLVRPFNQLMRDYTDDPVDAHHLLIEEVMSGVQFNVDGFAFGGDITPLGVVDSVMYPGTQAFQRFDYPSRLPPTVQQRARGLAERVMRALGFDHGLFNVEMFWDADRDALKIIEVNPRMAAQFADLYEKVDGFNLYDVQLDLALGRRPRPVAGRGPCGAAASFVFREFNGAIKQGPGRGEIHWLAAHHPDAVLQLFIKRGNSRQREMKWVGSYRYGAVNLGGADRDDLFRRFAEICAHLSFDPPRARIRVGGTVNALRAR